MDCRVEFDYVAQEADELTIKKGDIIKNVQIKMDGWFEGTLRGKTGVFPDNFVKVLEKDNAEPKSALNSEVVVLRNNSNSARRVKVLFSYSPEQDDELPLEVGDILEFIEEVEEGWWRGKLKEKEGIFPSNFVEAIGELQTNGDLERQSMIVEEPQHRDLPRNTKVALSSGNFAPEVSLKHSSKQANQSIDDEPAPELPPKPVRELARCFYPYNALNEDELTLSEGDIVTIISKQCEDEGWWRGELRGKIGLFPDNFVKIITPGEIQTGAGNFVEPHGKMLAQERNLVPPSDLPAKLKNGGGATTVDGGGLSKVIGAHDRPEELKVDLAKAKVSRTNSKESQQVPPIASKMGHIATSPISPGIAAFHSNLFSTQQKSTDTFAKNKDPLPVPKDEKVSDESEDFNSVERTEILSHLTATRAKAPKRRPPSTVISRENDLPVLNGTTHSHDSSIADSPPPNFSILLNHSVTSNGTLSGSYSDGGSSLNHSGTFLSHNNSRSDNKEDSPTPSSANSSSSIISKPKKQTLPWMAELKQTQDKKRNLTSPVAPSSKSGSPSQTSAPVTTATASANSSVTNVSPVPPQIQSGAKEHIKAPPLPAKPSSLSSTLSTSNNPIIQEKTLNNSNNTTPTNNISSSSPSSYGVSNKSFTTKKSSTSVPTINQNHHAATNSIVSSSSPVDISGQQHRGDGENSNIATSNKGYVAFEEHQALKIRVTSLENEIETLKRQLKLLLDRDLRGHIV